MRGISVSAAQLFVIVIEDTLRRGADNRTSPQSPIADELKPCRDSATQAQWQILALASGEVVHTALDFGSAQTAGRLSLEVPNVLAHAPNLPIFNVEFVTCQSIHTKMACWWVLSLTR